MTDTNMRIFKGTFAAVAGSGFGYGYGGGYGDGFGSGGGFGSDKDNGFEVKSD